MLTARLSEDHDTKIHPNQPRPSLDLPSSHLIPHAFAQRRSGLPHEKQGDVLVEPSSHRVRRQLVIQPARDEDPEQHPHFANFFRDPRAEPVSRVPSKDDKHPSKELVPTLGPEDRQRVRGERVVEEGWPEERGLMKESDAHKSHESVHRFESRQEHGPGHDVDGGGDGVTLDWRQREEYRPTEGRTDTGNELHTGIQ